MAVDKGGKGGDVFCSDEIRKGMFYSSRHTFAICDIAPVMPGHALVIPKRHVCDITELSRDELLDFFEVLAKVKAVILRIYSDSSGSYDMTAQIGEYSGRSVRHLHMHIIPRKKRDPYQDGFGSSVYDAIGKAEKLPEEEYRKRVEMLRNELDWREEKGQ